MPTDRNRHGHAVSAHGSYAVVGTPSNCWRKGTASFYESDGSGWTKVAQFFSPGPPTAPRDLGFGANVVMHGWRAAVAQVAGDAYFPDPGLVHIYNSDYYTAPWTKEETLGPVNSTLDGFGMSMAMYGPYLVVGAPLEDGNRGAAYIYKKGTSWDLLARVTASTPQPNDFFGYSVAAGANGYRIAIGKPGHFPPDYKSCPGAGPHEGVGAGNGSVEVFQRTGGGAYAWLDTLTDQDPGSRFGHAVAMTPADQIFVGAPGSETVYAYGRIGSDWERNADPIGAPSPGTGFGWTLRTLTTPPNQGDGVARIAVGAPNDDEFGIDSGSVWVFRDQLADPGNGSSPYYMDFFPYAKLQLAGAGAGDQFGYSVGESGNFTMVAGAPDAAGQGLGRAVAFDWRCDDPCAEGGSFDGANCKFGEAPTGTSAFIWEGAYYYTALPGNSCPYPGSWFDGGNCYVRPTPDGTSPFIWDNGWYYASCGPTDRPSFCDQYDGEAISFDTAHGTYLRALSWSPYVVDQASAASTWEEFAVLCQPDDTVAFRSAHNLYLRAQGAPDYPVRQGAAPVDANERWRPVRVPDDKWAFRSPLDGRYLRANSDGSVDQAEAIAGWEQFQITIR